MIHKKKKTAMKILLFLSFVPYALILIYGIFCAISGYNSGFLVKGSITYGWDAFVEAVFWTALLFTALIPILPICLIFQIICIIVKAVEKREEQ